MSFTRERYTVAEGGSVEVCAETSGTSDRAFIPLTINTTPGSELVPWEPLHAWLQGKVA